MQPALAAAVLNRLTSTIIGVAIELHRVLGPGLLEAAYLACLVHDLLAAGLHVETQRAIPLVYGGVTISSAYKADIVVEDNVIVEVKALDTLAPIHRRQLSTYLHLTKCPVGLLLNFGAMTMKEGIVRMVHNFPDE